MVAYMWRFLAVAVCFVGCARPAPRREPVETAPAPAIVRAPAVAVPQRPPSRVLRVLVGGDLIPHRPSLAAPAALESALAALAPLFGQADAVVANYEAATGELEKKPFRLAYAASPAWLAALPRTGIHAISIANNHACDLDYEGVETTIDVATRAGLTVLGGDAKSDPWAPRVIAERDGKKVCAVAWTTFVNAPGGCARTARLAVAKEDAAGRQKVALAIQRARATCDATVAIVHGGEEYVPQTATMMGVARQAAESGADAVVVHHPHVASPVVVHSTKDGRNIPIFASVGNLVSNQGESWKPPMFPVLRENRRLVCVNGWTRLGVLADLSFDLTAAPKLDWSFHLVWTDNDHLADRAKVPTIATRLLDPQKDAEILARLADDEVGPTDLFDDLCWTERPILTEGDRVPAARCSTTLVRTSAPTTALRTRKKR